MTGITAQMMLDGKVGILRTMPAPDASRSLLHFKRQTVGCGKPSDRGVAGEYLRTLDASDPKQLAILHSAGTLFRGAGYTPLTGTCPPTWFRQQLGLPTRTPPHRCGGSSAFLVICEALGDDPADTGLGA